MCVCVCVSDFPFSLGKKGWATVAPYLVKMGNDSLRQNCADSLSSCPDAVTGVTGCWIVSLSRVRACAAGRRFLFFFLFLLITFHVVFVAVVIIDDYPRTRRRSRLIRSDHRATESKEKVPEKREADDRHKGFLLPA